MPLTPRSYYIILAAALVLLFTGIAHQSGGVDTLKEAYKAHAGKPSDGVSPGSSLPDPPPSNRLSWHEIASKQGTDKVDPHHYWFMYEKYLEPLRNKKIKMLEIGLGCDMSYGPGKSYYTWLEFFPNVELYYMEYDAKCAEKWAHKTEKAKVFAGDQADVAFINRFLSEAGTDFDIIIDDGGHTMVQQMTSIEHLWKAVKPGGIYFCEDLQTSYHLGYGGDPQAANEGKLTMMRYIYKLLDDKMKSTSENVIAKDLRSIDCDREICAFIKKTPGTV